MVMRASERGAVRRAVATDCQVVRESDFRLVGKRTLDLSEGGLSVVTREELREGDALLVSLRAPGTNAWIDADAEVARIGKRGKKRSRRVGLRFRRMDGVELALLRGALVGHPPPVPRRALRRDYAATVLAIAFT